MLEALASTPATAALLARVAGHEGAPGSSTSTGGSRCELDGCRLAAMGGRGVAAAFCHLKHYVLSQPAARTDADALPRMRPGHDFRVDTSGLPEEATTVQTIGLVDGLAAELTRANARTAAAEAMAAAASVATHRFVDTSNERARINDLQHAKLQEQQEAAARVERDANVARSVKEANLADATRRLTDRLQAAAADEQSAARRTAEAEASAAAAVRERANLENVRREANDSIARAQQARSELADAGRGGILTGRRGVVAETSSVRAVQFERNVQGRDAVMARYSSPTTPGSAVSQPWQPAGDTTVAGGSRSSRPPDSVRSMGTSGFSIPDQGGAAGAESDAQGGDPRWDYDRDSDNESDGHRRRRLSRRHRQRGDGGDEPNSGPSGDGASKDMADSKEFMRLCRIEQVEHFTGNSGFDNNIRVAHDNFSWILGAIYYTNLVQKQLNRKLTDQQKILIITSRFKGEAREWYESLVWRATMIPHPSEPSFILADTGGDIENVLVDFQDCFRKRWMPANFPQLVRIEFETLEIAGQQLSQVREFSSKFDLMLAKLRVLGITYNGRRLAERLAQALMNAPRVLLHIRNRTVQIEDDDGVVRIRHGDATYESIAAGLNDYLMVTPVLPKRGGPSVSGGLRALDEVSDDGTDEMDPPEQDTLDADAHLAALEAQEREHEFILRMESLAVATEQDNPRFVELSAMADSRRRELECFNCGKTGHIGAECTEPHRQAFTDYMAGMERHRVERLQLRTALPVSAQRPSGGFGRGRSGDSVPGRGFTRPGRGRGSGQ